MVIPQPEPPTPWAAFKAALPASFDAFIDFIEDGGSLTEFCKREGIPRSTLRTWLAANPLNSATYAHATLERAGSIFDELIAISDEAEVVVRDGKVVLDATAVQRNKLRVDTRKWAISKLRPDVYGDKVQIDTTLQHKTMTDAQLIERLQLLGIPIATIAPQAQEASDDA